MHGWEEEKARLVACAYRAEGLSVTVTASPCLDCFCFRQTEMNGDCWHLCGVFSETYPFQSKCFLVNEGFSLLVITLKKLMNVALLPGQPVLSVAWEGAGPATLADAALLAAQSCSRANCSFVDLGSFLHPSRMWSSLNFCGKSSLWYLTTVCINNKQMSKLGKKHPKINIPGVSSSFTNHRVSHDSDAFPVYGFQVE